MSDRTDIDALLIGALYGELTPADEARLTAHLESHPADRTALADLTRTRATVRESRILSVQFEPPQSVSARLIQEAARRLPRREEQGWFHRFMRVLMVHPAVAVAAMFVLVVGIAGTLQLRGKDQLAPPEVSPSASSPAVTAPAAAPAQPVAESAAANSGSAAEPGASAPGSYQVGLAEARKQDEAKQDEAKNEQEKKTLPLEEGRHSALTKAGAEGEDDKRTARLEAKDVPALDVARSDPRPSKAPPKGAGIVVRSPEPMPKELEESQFAKRADGYRDGDRAREENQGARTGGAGGAAAGAPEVATQQPAAPAAAPAEPSTPNLPAAGPYDDSREVAKAKVPVRKPSGAKLAQASPSAAPPPPPPSSTPATRAEPSSQRDSRRLSDKPAVAAGKAADEKPSEDRVLLGWARKQHEQVVAFVKSSNCVAAANLATEIYGRAPDYYAANVATDRSVKPCVAYLNRERERQDRSRAAAKRAFSTEAPAATTPSPSKK